jgi:4-amino-4-deoxy-L-arabinose transferase-like glycosyltransferase
MQKLNLDIKDSRLQLILIVGIALIIRLILLYLSRNLGLIIWDEKDYNLLAANIIKGNGFSFDGQTPTAFRPPLYPAFVALIYYIANSANIIYVRIAQIIISLFNIVLVYLIGKDSFNKGTGILAALIFSIYPTLLGFNIFLLTEALFTFFLCLSYYFLLCFLKRERYICVILAGFFLGLTCLTRSLILGLGFLIGAFLLYRRRADLKKSVIYTALFFLSLALIITPWIIRNSRLFHAFSLIDTASGAQFFTGNSRYTLLNRSWDFHPDFQKDYTAAFQDYIKAHNLAANEATKSRAGIAKGLEFISGNPLLTVKRDIIKIFNLWGAEREIMAAFMKGYFGPQDKWLIFLVWAAIIFSYSFLVLTGVFGIIFGYAENKAAGQFFLLTVFYFTFIHALVFGHSRYHVPLVPLIGIYSSYALLNTGKIWNSRKTAKFKFSIGLCFIFVLIWIRDLAVFISGKA